MLTLKMKTLIVLTAVMATLIPVGTVQAATPAVDTDALQVTAEALTREAASFAALSSRNVHDADIDVAGLSLQGSAVVYDRTTNSLTTSDKGETYILYVCPEGERGKVSSSPCKTPSQTPLQKVNEQIKYADYYINDKLSGRITDRGIDREAGALAKIVGFKYSAKTNRAVMSDSGVSRTVYACPSKSSGVIVSAKTCKEITDLENKPVKLTGVCLKAVTPIRAIMKKYHNGLSVSDKVNTSLVKYMGAARKACSDNAWADFYAYEYFPWLNGSA
jgi:hypothetical protein